MRVCLCVCGKCKESMESQGHGSEDAGTLITEGKEANMQMRIPPRWRGWPWCTAGPASEEGENKRREGGETERQTKRQSVCVRERERRAREGGRTEREREREREIETECV